MKDNNKRDINKDNKNIMWKMMLVGTKFRRFLFLVAFTLGAFVLMFALNFSFKYLTRNFNIKLDMSSGRLYSLSRQTKDYIKSYDRKIKFFMFDDDFIGVDNFGGAVWPEILQEVAAASPNFKFECVVGPTQMKSKKDYFSRIDLLNKDNNGGVYGSRDRVRILAVDETDAEHLKGYMFNSSDGIEFLPIDFEDVTRADKRNAPNRGPFVACSGVERRLVGVLERLSQKNSIKAAATTGHSEFDYTLNSRFFEDMGVSLEKLDLNSGEISPQHDLVVVAAPSKDFSEQEIAKLESYLNGGGKLFVCASAVQGELPNFDGFLKKFGFSFSQGCVIDSSNTDLGSYIKIDLSSVESDYTKNMIERNWPFACEGCRPMKVEAAQDGWSNFEICRTSNSCVVVDKTTKGLADLPKSDFVFACGAQKKVEGDKVAKVIVLSGVGFCEGLFSGDGVRDRRSMTFGGSKLCNVKLSNGDFLQSLFREVSGKQGVPFVPLKFGSRSGVLDLYSDSNKGFRTEKVYYIVNLFGITSAFIAIAAIFWLLRKRKK